MLAAYIYLILLIADNGYYLYADDKVSQLNLSRPWENPDPSSTDEEETIMDEVASHIMYICLRIG